MRRNARRTPCRAFSLIELLVVIAIIVLLMAIALPALRYGRMVALDLKCKANLRVLGAGMLVYGMDYKGKYPPLAWWRESPARYFWGTNANPPDFSRGLIKPYVQVEAGELDSIYDCPSQPWGSYIPQGAGGVATTTYGYNGYYLCPSATPGWSGTIGRRPWRSQYTVQQPGKVFMLADTLMVWGPGVVTNNCLLDPPWIYSGGGWRENPSTTLCFRHLGRANVCFADGHVEGLEPTKINDPENMVGYVGESNAPHYVPDWKKW